MEVDAGSCSPALDATDNADAESDGPTREELGDDYWDPPCKVCKKVDDEANVLHFRELCRALLPELCNSPRYHLACIANIKPPLPRSCRADSEWFCRPCIKRGVPEAILDRVGQRSAAHYLVKWLGFPSSEVSWMSAIDLDTPWSRKIIRHYLEVTEPAKASDSQLFPACHPLVDTLRAARAAATEADTVVDVSDAPPTAEAQADGGRLLACVRTLAARVPHTHALAPLAREVVRLARHMDHPRCGELAPWVAPLDPTAQAANAAVARAAPALSDAIGKLEKSLGVAPAGKHGSSGRGHRRGGGGGANGHSRNRAAVSPLSSSSASSDSSSAASASSAQTAATASSSSSSLRMVSTDELLAQLADLCDAKRADAPAHTLAPTALAAARGLLLFEVALEWTAAPPAALTTRRNALDAAATALRILRKTLDELIGPPPPAAASATSLAERAETAEEKAYCSLLLYIRENRDRLHQQAQSEQQAEAAAGGASAGAEGAASASSTAPTAAAAAAAASAALAVTGKIEQLAASEIAALPSDDRAQLGQRALAMYRSALPGLPPTLSGVARRGHFAGGCSDAHGGGSSGVRGHGGGGVSRRRKPCSVCQGLDKRDALVCATCNTRMHLMCAWPPLESVSDEVWHCDACRSTVPPLRKVPTPGEELEAEVQESEANGGAVVWKRAVVLSARPKERFVLMINPDEEDDFIEEYGMEDEGKEWRRTAAVEALNSARQKAEKVKEEVARARERGRRPRPRDDA